ncbi:MAG: YgiT-type zinc finger protein [Firmicutes bacterium]|nr:YgiT-type zinc finger protein [Bacillota bacterium]
MKCPICGGQMATKKVDVDETWKGRTITFRGIEAQVCDDCGETIYDAAVVALMESLIESTLGKPEYPEIMNVEEVSRFLRVTPQTVYNMLRDGRIQATKVGREWRFTKEAIMKIFDLPTPALARYRSSACGAIKAKEAMEKYRVKLRAKAEKKKEEAGKKE